MIVDSFENLSLYFSSVAGLDKAAKFLCDFAKGEIKNGRYDIDGDKVYANVSTYSPKEFSSDMLFEAHRKYIDLQAVIAGGERIDWAPLGSLKEESEEYSKGGDAAFYSGDAHINVCLKAGEFALLLPDDAHKPCIHSDFDSVTKAVIKIAVEG